MNRFQTALAGQREYPACFQMQHELSALALEPLDPERHFLSGSVRQQILQAFKAGYRQRSFENVGITGKRETVRNPFQT